MIPAPGDVHYARTSKTATFSILDTVLPLVAKIELENGDGTWSSFNEFTVGDATYGEASASFWKALQVSLCEQYFVFFFHQYHSCLYSVK